MKSKSCFIILALILVFSLVSCAPAPVPAPKSEPIPTPTQPPTQTPTLTPPPVAITPSIPPIGKPSLPEEEMAVKLWAMLPEGLPDGFLKSQFNSKMRKAIYQGNGKWQFEVAGSGTDSTLLPLRKYEKTPDNWVENYSREVTTYNLILIATYYEKTSILEIMEIQKLDEKTEIETTSETPIIGKGLEVIWIEWFYTGHKHRVEGSVKNIGMVPLNGLRIKVYVFNDKGNRLGEKDVEIYPDEKDAKVILPEKTGHFLVTFIENFGESSKIRYNYRFFHGYEEIYFESPQ